MPSTKLGSRRSRVRTFGVRVRARVRVRFRVRVRVSGVTAQQGTHLALGLLHLPELERDERGVRAGDARERLGRRVCLGLGLGLGWG